MQSLTIRTPAGATRRFTATETPDGRGYVLTGARGAMYAVVRYVDTLDQFHVIAWNGREVFPGVVLTDRNGSLEQEVR